jgi:nucleotidyltransferase substrate binding protein (TIGR01987 family)
MALDLSPLGNAVARLDEILTRYQSDTSDDDIRDGLIHRFEFTYDLAHRMVRRALAEQAANPEEIQRMGFPALIRTANESGLIGSEWAVWHRYREMRNITSHTYDQAKAAEVAAGIPAFLVEAKDVLARLQGDGR